MQAKGTSYYKVPVAPGKMYLVKATPEEVRGTWEFHFYVYDDGIRGTKLASAGYINGNEYKSALIETFTGPWLYIEVLSSHIRDGLGGGHFEHFQEAIPVARAVGGRLPAGIGVGSLDAEAVMVARLVVEAIDAVVEELPVHDHAFPGYQPDAVLELGSNGYFEDLHGRGVHPASGDRHHDHKGDKDDQGVHSRPDAVRLHA